MKKDQLLEYSGIVNHMLKEIGSDWRLGMITKAWPEDMKDDLNGGIDMMIWVFKTPILIKGEKEPVWMVHPESHKKYCKACGDPDGRWPMILNQAITLVGVKNES